MILRNTWSLYDFKSEHEWKLGQREMGTQIFPVWIGIHTGIPGCPSKLAVNPNDQAEWVDFGMDLRQLVYKSDCRFWSLESV